MDKEYLVMNPLELAKIASKKSLREIIFLTYCKPSTVKEMSQIIGESMASVYRKVKYLESHKIIRLAGRALTNDGKRVSLYKSRIKEINIIFENGKLAGHCTLDDKCKTEQIHTVIELNPK